MPFGESFQTMLIAQSIGHCMAGVVLSLGDRLLSRPRPTSRRAQLARRLDALKILDYLTRAEAAEEQAAGDAATGSAAPPAGAPDAGEIREACAFLRARIEEGEILLQPGEQGMATQATAAVPATPPGDGHPGLRLRAASTWESARGWLRHEKLNQHRALTKLKIGYGIEIVADLIVAASAVFWGRGNFFGALGHSIYQGAAMGIGLIAGGFLFRRRDHRAPRRLRKTVEELDARLADDPRARRLLERLGEGELPALGALGAGDTPAGGGAAGARPAPAATRQTHPDSEPRRGVLDP